jgi:hypothetical protein
MEGLDIIILDNLPMTEVKVWIILAKNDWEVGDWCL